MKYRKKPVVIDAIQWTGLNVSAVLKFCHELVLENMAREKRGVGEIPAIQLQGRSIVEPKSNKILLYTLEGMMLVSADDWIIRGVAGEFYPCKPAIFSASYEPAE